ncbi:MAG: hypothetical protein R6U96_00150 [Promethearchaeia archaeon]
MKNKYKCPNCGNAEKPKTICFFHPRIVRCTNCGEKFLYKEFIDTDDYHLSPMPKM